MIPEGWRDAVQSGRYVGVYYDCASAFAARWIGRIANEVGDDARSVPLSDRGAVLIVRRSGRVARRRR
jgi:hypothetical protein